MLHIAYCHVSALQNILPQHITLAVVITLCVCWCVWQVYLLAGEGYECTVTVDDEDSKVIIFDNWKQVSNWLSASRFSHSVLFISFSLDWFLVVSCSSDQFLSKPSLSSSVLWKWKQPFVWFLSWANYLCEWRECVHTGVLTVLVLSEVLSFGKVEITLLLTFIVSIKIYSEQENFGKD